MSAEHPVRATIDLNCDLGEGQTAEALAAEAAMIRLISSANIACGQHAGDLATMRNTVQLCREHQVAIGAHPGFADREGMGRREITLPSATVRKLVLGQLQTLETIVESAGGRMTHVKPHGALYNMAARDRTLADLIAQTIAAFDPTLLLYGLAGSHLMTAGTAAGLVTVSEVFADRTYQANGTLTPRSQPEGVILQPQRAAQQVLDMVQQGMVQTMQGTTLAVCAETVCIHGDSPDAVTLARMVRQALEASGIQILPRERP
ncbi:MAG: LamB/YcsF family protein [Planctomycetota bacterium]|nr:MAG: LamB/YcsF family protein [Planctomycetota bacterium]